MKKYFKKFVFCFLFLIALAGKAQNNFLIQYNFIGKDSTIKTADLKLQTSFNNKNECVEYVFKIPSLLQSKGFIAASVDDIKYDSSFALVTVFLGKQYHWAHIYFDSSFYPILAANSVSKNILDDKPVNFEQLEKLQTGLLDYFENNGYPFAKVVMDSFVFKDDKIFARLNIAKGNLYTIDSFRLFGNVKLSDNFLHRYLDLPKKSLYKKSRLSEISRRLTQLPYLQEEKPWQINMFPKAAWIDFYLKAKRSSQINGIIGFLPNNDQLQGNKLLVTGEVNINLLNSFANGENIKLNWQQIQPQSPRLQLAYNQPFLFKSPFGIDFAFDLLKKDTSYVNINIHLGTQLQLSAWQKLKVLLQSSRTILLDIDTNSIKTNKRLPEQIDVSAFGLAIDYEYLNTNYRFNPRKGYELKLFFSSANKTIKRNNTIIQLKDPTNPSFNFNALYDSLNLSALQFRARLSAAKYFPLGKSATLKTALDAGLFQSPSSFRNELFQIGGYKLLRGFDEESIFASQYIVTTFEYRYLYAQNAYIYAFTDFGVTKNKTQNTNFSNQFIGVGFGIILETKAGLFNVSFASGKRNDLPYSFRQSKIHFGYVSLF